MAGETACPTTVTYLQDSTTVAPAFLVKKRRKSSDRPHPGVTDEGTIRRFVEALRFPLNVLIGAGTPPIPRLQELGAARVSAGSGLARAAMGLTRRIAQELKTSGTYEATSQGAIPYSSLNRLFEK